MKKPKDSQKAFFSKEFQYFAEWANQVNYLILFTAVLCIATMTMNYFVLLKVSPELALNTPIYALVITLAAFGTILIASIQIKKAKLIRQLRQ